MTVLPHPQFLKPGPFSGYPPHLGKRHVLFLTRVGGGLESGWALGRPGMGQADPQSPLFLCFSRLAFPYREVMRRNPPPSQKEPNPLGGGGFGLEGAIVEGENKVSPAPEPQALRKGERLKARLLGLYSSANRSAGLGQAAR